MCPFIKMATKRCIHTPWLGYENLSWPKLLSGLQNKTKVPSEIWSQKKQPVYQCIQSYLNFTGFYGRLRKISRVSSHRSLKVGKNQRPWWKPKQHLAVLFADWVWLEPAALRDLKIENQHSQSLDHGSLWIQSVYTVFYKGSLSQPCLLDAAVKFSHQMCRSESSLAAPVWLYLFFQCGPISINFFF